jgi:DNA polymerase III psi subunit
MRIENPAALRFIIDDDLYLLNKDKQAAALAPFNLITPPISVETLSVQKPVNAETAVVEFKYMGGNKKNFLIMVHYADREFMDDGHLTALENILKRMELYMDDVAILNMANHAVITLEEATNYFSPKKMLLMGQKALPQNMAAPVLNQSHQLQNCRALYSFSFDEMMSSNENKRVFWEQMKTL